MFEEHKKQMNESDKDFLAFLIVLYSLSPDYVLLLIVIHELSGHVWRLFIASLTFWLQWLCDEARKPVVKFKE